MSFKPLEKLLKVLFSFTARISLQTAHLNIPTVHLPSTIPVSKFTNSLFFLGSAVLLIYLLTIEVLSRFNIFHICTFLFNQAYQNYNPVLQSISYDFRQSVDNII